MSQFSRETCVLQERYYKIYRIILKILGLWPYQQTYLTRLYEVLLVGIILTFLLVQV